MRHQFIIGGIGLVTLLGLVLIVRFSHRTTPMPTINTGTQPATNVNAANLSTPTPAVSDPLVVTPINDFSERVTKKPFGIYITPTSSPVQPEKFTGYHTGADAEAAPAEATLDIPIVAIAEGVVMFAGHVNGYGGVIVIRHTINDETILTLYGHLRITSFTVSANKPVKAGQQIAVLGTGFTNETDGERKHLHFSIINRSTISYRGYVAKKSELSDWIDPIVWLKNHTL